VLLIAVIGGITVPSLFWILSMIEMPLVGFAFLGWIVLGYPFYRLRLRRYEKKDVDLKERMKSLHSHEQEAAAGD
jgi:APA family basic amino acid/polyamine antiporter